LRQFVQRTGVGGQADFNALISADPHFASAWGDIQTQLVTEGVTDFTGAQQAFTDSFQQLASQSFGLSLDTGTVGNAYATAKQYVMTGQTIAGAVSTVTGLIGSIESNTMQPLAVMQTFTGTKSGSRSHLQKTYAHQAESYMHTARRRAPRRATRSSMSCVLIRRPGARARSG
jgi:hypothetical protein